MSIWDKIQIVARYGDKGLQMINILDMFNKTAQSYSGSQGFVPPKYSAPVEEVKVRPRVNVRPRITEPNLQGLLGHYLDPDKIGKPQ